MAPSETYATTSAVPCLEPPTPPSSLGTHEVGGIEHLPWHTEGRPIANEPEIDYPSGNDKSTLLETMPHDDGLSSSHIESTYVDFPEPCLTFGNLQQHQLAYHANPHNMNLQDGTIAAMTSVNDIFGCLDWADSGHKVEGISKEADTQHHLPIVEPTFISASGDPAPTDPYAGDNLGLQRSRNRKAHEDFGLAPQLTIRPTTEWPGSSLITSPTTRLNSTNDEANCIQLSLPEPLEVVEKQGTTHYGLPSAATCPECHTTVRSVFLLDTHRRKSHQQCTFVLFHDGALVDVDRITGSFHCPRCPYEDVDPENMATHCAVRHVNTVASPECARCSFGFTNSAVQHYHWRTVHTRRAKVYFRDRTFQIIERRNGCFHCQSCMFASVDPEKLNYHTSMIHETNIEVVFQSVLGQVLAAVNYSSEPPGRGFDDDVTRSRVKRRKMHERSPSPGSEFTIAVETTMHSTGLEQVRTPPMTPKSTDGALDTASHIPQIPRDIATTTSANAALNSPGVPFADSTEFHDLDSLLEEDFGPCEGFLKDAEALIDFDQLLNRDIEVFG